MDLETRANSRCMPLNRSEKERIEMKSELKRKGTRGTSTEFQSNHDAFHAVLGDTTARGKYIVETVSCHGRKKFTVVINQCVR